MSRCEVNTAGREEDCGSLVTYVPCGKTAVAEARAPHRPREWYVCDEHAAELEGTDVIVSRFDEE